MKRTALLLALLIASAAAAVAQYQVSKLPLADPFVFYEDGTYYAYGTYSGDGIVVFTSDNLIEWQPCTRTTAPKSNGSGLRKYIGWATDM